MLNITTKILVLRISLLLDAMRGGMYEMKVEGKKEKAEFIGGYLM